MRLHIETAPDRASAVDKANKWIESNLKSGQFYSATITPLLQLTVDVKVKGNIFGKPETLTRRLVYDYTVIINYFGQEEMIPMNSDAINMDMRPSLPYEG